jgi:hypothetical protein
MKKLMILILCLTMGGILIAQAPAAFKYQAVARDATGAVLVSKTVSFWISILQGSATGATVFSEIHSATTNEFGLVNLEIGRGTNMSGSLDLINWGSDVYFLKIDMDPNGGVAFVNMGITQLLSVPYAMHAKTVEIDQVNDADADPLNEMQILELSGTDLSLSKGGGTVTLPTASNPTGAAGGDLFGTYPNPLIGDNKITSAKLANGAVLGSKIAPAGALAGQALKWNGTTWTPMEDLGSSWSKSGNNLYYPDGWIGIGTETVTQPLTIKSISSTCYFSLTDNSGANGMRIGSYFGNMYFTNDNLDKIIQFSGYTPTGYKTMLTIQPSNSRVGINNSRPDATLDINGSLKVGSQGITVSEIIEVTGTTSGADSYYKTFAYPAGYNLTNTRVLSVEINYTGATWVGLGFTNGRGDQIPISYNLTSTGITIYYPNLMQFHTRSFRVNLMQVE